jgi:hypothetical protein
MAALVPAPCAEGKGGDPARCDRAAQGAELNCKNNARHALYAYWRR